MNKILCFTHTDLDGVGVGVISSFLAQSLGLDFECYNCNYDNINDTVMEILHHTQDEQIHQIIIGDISVDEPTAEHLDALHKKGVNLILRDHHATATWLNKYEWAQVQEATDGVSRCGTWLIFNQGVTITQSKHLVSKLKVFVDTVDSWDTWKWKVNNDLDAYNLNALFQMLGFDEFMEYMDEIIWSYSDIQKSSELFTDNAHRIIGIHNRQLKNSVKRCENSLITSKLCVEINNVKKTYKSGTVFVDRNTSEIADKVLSNHPELDILLLVNFPYAISLRTQKQLDIPLGDLAQLLTGNGGGHPKAAGASITKKDMVRLIRHGVKSFSNGKVTITSTED